MTILSSGLPASLTPRISSHLDMIRGIAALAVLIGHIRGLFFLDFQDLAAKPPVTALIYAITGLGHQAVMVFFVLSGFFIGGSVLSTLDRWSWRLYLVNRLSRLYLVLLPALLLTAALDYCAARAPAGHIYFDQPIAHFNTYPLAGRGSPGVFAGNVLFLQNIIVPTFGSNSPLWSLANEFWYYILFPLGGLAVFPGSNVRRRLGYGLIGLALAVWLRASVLSGFVIWLFGAGIHFLPAVSCQRASRVGLNLVTVTIFGFALALSRTGRIPGNWSDIAIGFTFASWLYCIIKIQAAPSRALDGYDWVARLFAQCSYSVYAIHFPIVLLIRTSVGSSLWAPTPVNLALWGGVATAIFFIGLLFSRVTEARTAALRTRLLRVFIPPASIQPRVVKPVSA